MFIFQEIVYKFFAPIICHVLLFSVLGFYQQMDVMSHLMKERFAKEYISKERNPEGQFSTVVENPVDVNFYPRFTPLPPPVVTTERELLFHSTPS